MTTKRRFAILVTGSEAQGFTCHLYRRGLCIAQATGGTPNNAVRLAVFLYRAA